MVRTRERCRFLSLCYSRAALHDRRAARELSMQINLQPFGANSVTDAMAQAFGRFQVFKVSGNFTAPKSGNYLVIAIGGGGGGGGGGGVTAAASRSGSGGGGGGGGLMVTNIVTIAKDNVVGVTIGAGGIGGAGNLGLNGADGSSGGDTVFGAFFTALGGTPGRGGIADFVTEQFRGERGSVGGGYGGGVAGIITTAASSDGSNGAAGFTPGAGGGGGGGASNNGTANRKGGDGGNGAPGICIVIW